VPLQLASTAPSPEAQTFCEGIGMKTYTLCRVDSFASEWLEEADSRAEA
jgi:hypothetical protein